MPDESDFAGDFEVFLAPRKYKGKQWRYRNLKSSAEGVPGMWFDTAEDAEKFLRGLGSGNVNVTVRDAVTPSEIEKPDELQVSCISPPEKMDNEALAAFVVDGVQKIRGLIPYLRELKARFQALPRGKADIMGCATWQDFCERKLHRTPEAIRQALAAPRLKEPEKPKLLLAALKHLLPTADPKLPIVRFSRAEDGNVLLVVDSDAFGWAREILPVPATTTAPSMWPGYKESLYKYVLAPIDLNPPPPAWRLPADAPDHGRLELFAPPFKFYANIKFMMDFLKHCDGDPYIVAYANGGPIYMWQTEHGQLHIEFEATNAIDEAFAARAQAQRAALEETERETLRAQPYIGDFMPGLKIGDEVTVGGEDDAITVEEVTAVDGIEIVTEAHTFTREGQCGDWHILRLATDEEINKAALAHAQEELEREEERAQEEAARANERHAEQEFKDKRAEIKSKAVELVKNTKIRLVGRGWDSDSAFYSGSSLLLSIEANITLEELERIVNALQPPASEIPTVDCGTSGNSENGKE